MHSIVRQHYSIGYYMLQRAGQLLKEIRLSVRLSVTR